MSSSLFDQIDVFSETHDAICGKWNEIVQKENFAKINFNKKQVRDIDLDVLQYIYKYQNMLAKMAPLINVIFSDKDVNRTRVKEILSITQKVDRYRNSSLQGKVIINKCLNDLFGARVVVNKPFDFDQMTMHIQQHYPKQKIKVINSCNALGYKAVHVYKKAPAGHFYWELQVWHYADYENNIRLHESYKREYISGLKELGEQG